MGDPLTRPAPAEEDAGAVHPLPQGGEGRSYTDTGSKLAAEKRQPAAAGRTPEHLPQ
jgi:hypothetical protein